MAPDLLLDTQWRKETATALSSLETNADGLTAINGPSSTNAVRDDFVMMGALIYEFTGLYMEGIDTFDANLIGASMEALTDATQHGNAAERKMLNFCG